MRRRSIDGRIVAKQTRDASSSAELVWRLVRYVGIGVPAIAVGRAGGEMMDSFEFTKISAAVLMALLVIFFPKTLVEMARHGGHAGGEAGGYALPAGGGEAVADKKEAEVAFEPAAVVSMIATANSENGAGTFKKCLSCHSAEKGAAAKAGPNLWNVVGRNKGIEAFAYSDALKAKSDEKWTFANLAAFVHGPKAYLPGTKMNFAGVTDPSDLADLLAYVRTLSDNPAPIE